MDNCLIVEGGSVTGLRTSNGDYTFNVPISQLKNKDFIAAFERDPIKALQGAKVKIDGLSQNNIVSSEFTNHSGGAIGSDTEWDNIGREFGMVNNKHYWTETKTPNGNTEITQEEFEEGRFESAKAAKRNFGYQYSTMKDSRLIRNWSQVKNSDAIFAIGKIVKTGEKIFPNQANDTRVAQVPSVTGGTGYAVGMGINKNKPVFVFNQTKGSYDIGWYKWDATVNDFVKTETPKLTKDFAGIGTREINDAGKKAIRDVYVNTFNNTQETDAAKTEIKGINVYTKSEDSLGKKLTNPSNDYPISFRGERYLSAEHTYQTWKTGEFDIQGYNAKGAKVKGDLSKIKQNSFNMMVDILESKFDRYPELAREIESRGGLDFIKKSTHNVTGEDKFWESVGGENKFIEALAKAYEKYNEPLFSKFNTESNPTQDFKDLIQSLSDKLGIPVRYDNNLPYAGAFIDGNVVLNPSKMDETTVWHEFAHPFVQAVRKQNKPLYDNLVNEIYNTPHGKALLKEVQSLYGEKNKKIQEEEVIVELIARYATGKIDGFTAKKYKSIWDKVKDFIRSIGDLIFGKEKSDVFNLNLNMTIEDIANMLQKEKRINISENVENEIYESRFGKKDINKESPEAIYKEVEEVFIEMRLTDEKSLDYDKISSFDLFLNSVFENVNVENRILINNILLKDPKFETYTQNKFKFQLQQYKKSLEDETNPDRIEQYNTIIEILEAKELFETSDFDYQTQIQNIEKEAEKTVDKKLIGRFAKLGVLSFFGTYAATVIGQSPEAFTIGAAITTGSFFIASSFSHFRNKIFNFLSGKAKNKYQENFDNINANLYGLNNKKRIQEYIDLISERLERYSKRLNDKIDWVNERIKDEEESLQMKIERLEKDIKNSTDRNKNEKYTKEIETVKRDAAQYIKEITDSVYNDREYLSKQFSEEEETNMIKLRNILTSLLSKGNLENIPEISMKNKYESLMDSLLKNYGNKKLNTSLIIEDMLDKVLSNKAVPGFITRYASRAGLMSEVNDFNKNLFKSELEKFINAYNVENLKSDSDKLDELLSDYQFNQILDPLSFNNQSLLSDILLDSEYKALPENIKNKKDITNLKKEDLVNILNEKDSLYESTVKKMLLELNEYEYLNNNRFGKVKMSFSVADQLKQVLSDYGISYDSFSPQLKSQIETKLTNNPELLDDSNFIKSLTC